MRQEGLSGSSLSGRYRHYLACLVSSAICPAASKPVMVPAVNKLCPNKYGERKDRFKHIQR